MISNGIIELVKAIGIIVTTILSLLLTYRLNKMHKQFNSKMDEALKTKYDLGKADGKAEVKS